MKTIGIIGSGPVGKTLATGFLKFGYSTMIGSRSVDKQKRLVTEIGNGILVGNFAELFGFDVEDMGSAAAARAIEPLCML